MEDDHHDYDDADEKDKLIFHSDCCYNIYW